METPVKTALATTKRKYSAEDKKQLLANLEIEVAHRTRQFEESLLQILENFKNHHEGQVLRVPKLVRNITMGEFADKYNGNINECLRGLQRDRQGGEPSSLDMNLKKRKWKSKYDPPGPDEVDSSRVRKTARIVSSPAKIDSSRTQSTKTPGRLRPSRHASVSRSPVKQMGQSLPISPSKHISRLPSSNDFNPLLPKTPAYPRTPRKKERIMGANSSSLANLSDEPDAVEDEDTMREHRTIKRTRSIVLRRDPSFSGSQMQHAESHSHSKSSSQSTLSSSQSLISIPSAESLAQPVAFMRVPTRDGLVLEFDPLLATPDELDTLEGITDSARKQAREDMTRLVQAALTRWKI